MNFLPILVAGILFAVALNTYVKGGQKYDQTNKPVWGVPLFMVIWGGIIYAGYSITNNYIVGNEYVEYELNICERKLLLGDWNIQKSEFDLEKDFTKFYTVICDTSFLTDETNIETDTPHILYDEKGRYYGIETTIPGKKAVIKCYPNKSTVKRRKYVRIEGYPGVCEMPYSRSGNYIGEVR